jgi:hypothetical protein
MRFLAAQPAGCVNPFDAADLFQRSKARQYSSVMRIWFSIMRPTSSETEVFSSAAFLRAHKAASSLTVIVMFFNAKSE